MAPNAKVPVPARDRVEVAGLPEPRRQPIDQFLEKPHGRGSRHLYRTFAKCSPHAAESAIFIRNLDSPCRTRVFLSTPAAWKLSSRTPGSPRGQGVTEQSLANGLSEEAEETLDGSPDAIVVIRGNDVVRRRQHLGVTVRHRAGPAGPCKERQVIRHVPKPIVTSAGQRLSAISSATPTAFDAGKEAMSTTPSPANDATSAAGCRSSSAREGGDGELRPSRSDDWRGRGPPQTMH